MLGVSPARVVVMVGSAARYAFHEYLLLEVPGYLVAPVEGAGRDRLLVIVRHPNSRGGVQSASGQCTQAQLLQVRAAPVDSVG